MRNKVKLYIEGTQADLDNGSFLLLNYTAEDLSNPTIVKNSFSRQITLKGTPRNDAIFGHIYRNDRDTVYGSPYTGPNFDPTRKTSFTIYNERNEILEAGYLKLDEVSITKKGHTFKCTLFGGLGSFLYGLSYKSSGEKMTLADLYYDESTFDGSFSFRITREAVADAWARLGGDITKDAMWSVINFMPSYLGLPSSPFDAQKCLVLAATSGLKYRDGDYSTNPNGYTLVTLNEKVTANEAKDFRSYLQKPVMKFESIIRAICDSNYNGGYTVNLDTDFFIAGNPYYSKAWLTLPMFNDLNINETSTQTTQTMSQTGTILPIVGGGGSGLYKVTVNMNIYAYMMGLPALNYKLWFANAQGRICNMLVFTVTLYDSNQAPIATAVSRATTSGLTIASQFPQPDLYFDHIDGQGYFVDSNGNPVTLPLYIEAEGAAYYRVDVGMENYVWGSASFNPGDQSWRMWETGETTYTDNYYFDPRNGDCQVDIFGTSSSTVRTGALITKAALLGGSKSPAEYLLSYCKMFGLQLVAHKDTKTIDIVMRKNLYNGGTVDINARIDRGREMTKRPFSFDAKWYLFGNEAQGEYAQYYKANFGRPFGQYRVNTGYDFDAQQKPMTEGIIFGNAVSVMETSKFFCTLVKDGRHIPAVFLAGGKYDLYNGSDTKAIDLPNFFDATKTWDNPSYPMHDEWEKVQFHGAQNAHIDDRDTRVFFGGMENTTGKDLSLTDDFEDMLALNGNNPCWAPNQCRIDPLAEVTQMPRFSRYMWSGSTIERQFDWGDPLEVQIPGVSLGAGSSIFPAYWEKYIGDRYDDDSAVVTAWVDLRGMRVDETLLRQFYAFDGALWALNRIIDHSLTTFGPTKCEFVKVQAITNYTTL